jgi:abortive infection bacteriophage resistance protein
MNSSNKPFKNYNEQINLLKNRNLQIKEAEKAIKILSDVNYYRLINGYKDLFLEKKNGSSEFYKEGTTIDDIYALYEFDRKLRIKFLEYILIVEIKIKTLISYYFSEAYPGNYKKEIYLIKQNFDYNQNPSKGFQKEKNKRIERLIANIEDAIKHEYGLGNQAIKHYKDIYAYIPLWVVGDILTFGNISFFYDAMKVKQKNKIAKLYGLKKDSMNPKALYNIFMLINFCRNICAHEKRLYKLNVNRNIKYPKILKKIYKQHGQNKLFSVVVALFWVLDKNKFSEFYNALVSIIDKMENTKNMPKEKILFEMGFPTNWKDINDIKASL